MSVTVETVLAIFPGAEIIVDQQPAVWPPRGGWIPGGTMIDPFSDTMPCHPQRNGTGSGEGSA